jgi:hypothetical protein
MKKVSILFTSFTLLSGAAFAQQQAPRMQAPPTPAPGTAREVPAPAAHPSVDVGAIFDKMNTSHTGKLTKAEAQAVPTVAANFDAADANHDGVLSKDEFLAAFKPMD